MARKTKTPQIETSIETPVKATDAEIARRVATVHKLMVAGASRASIVQYGSKEWKITERQVDDYIASAKETIKAQTDRDKDNNLSMALARMGDIFQQCMSAKNYKGAIAAQQEINKLLGLYEPVNQNHTGDVAIRLIRETNFNPTPQITEDNE